MDKFPLAMSAVDVFNNIALHSGPHSMERYFIERGEQKIQS